MKKSTLAVAVTLGAIAQQAGAAGFIEDSKATLGLRNFYINTDNREGTANPSRNEEWGQGFDLRFISGYTQGTVGFGLDDRPAGCSPGFRRWHQRRDCQLLRWHDLPEQVQWRSR